MIWQSDILINPYIQEAIENLIIPGVNLEAYGPGLSEAEIVGICEDLNTATCYLIDAVEGSQDLDTALDAVEQSTQAHGVSMDVYLDNMIENLEGFFECPKSFL